MKPRIFELPRTAETATSASSRIAKYDGAPSCTTAEETLGANSTRSAVAMVPATKDPMAAVARAWAARPRFAIWLPSIAVTTDEDSPGVLSRIDVVDPPYMPP